MKATFGLACDYAFIEPATNKLSILGVIRYIITPTVPMQLRRLCIAIELEGSLAESRHSPYVTLELVDHDGVQVVPLDFKVPVQLTKLGPDEPNRGFAVIVLELNQLPLPAFGSYTIMVFDQAHAELSAVKFTLVQLQTSQALPADT